MSSTQISVNKQKNSPEHTRVLKFYANSDFSKKKSVHSVTSLWFITILIFVVVVVKLSSHILHDVPELKDAVRESLDFFLKKIIIFF
jgi:hypothetical protein